MALPEEKVTIGMFGMFRIIADLPESLAKDVHFENHRCCEIQTIEKACSFLRITDELLDTCWKLGLGCERNP